MAETNIDNWDAHWAQYAAAASMNPAQRMRHQLVADLLELPTDGTGVQLCDIGSGQGDLMVGLKTRWPAADCAGIELSAEGVAISRRKVPAARFFVCDLFKDTPAAFGLERWASHAVCSEVLEHVDDPVAFLKRARGFLAPGCRLVVTVPGGPQSAFDRHIGHRQHFDRRKIAAVLNAADFDVERAFHSGFPFFNLYRCVVILRGRRLVSDVEGSEGGASTGPAAMAMRLFRVLFRLNLRDCALGWQVVAVARKRG